MFQRWTEAEWQQKLATPFVQIVFGARQTGKSTLLKELLPNPALRLDFSDPGQRSSFLSAPEQLIGICKAMPLGATPPVIVIDEAQNVPGIFDAVQHLYDGDKTRWRFVLCGSSARKLRVLGTNLLPGRCMVSHLYPLTTAERPCLESEAVHFTPASPLPWAAISSPLNLPLWPAVDLITRLAWGDLPGIVSVEENLRSELLRAYCLVYLAEELRREALVKNWAAFSRFLKLAALESGRVVNYSNIAQQAGVSHPTVKSHYELLEDMFVGFRVPPFSGSTRKGLLSTPRFYFFDLGVRHAAAGLNPSRDTALADAGSVFEQWVGIELWKRLQYQQDGQLSYLRTKDGAEVDYIIEKGGVVTPIEVKWTERPTLSDARHLLIFLKEQGSRAPHGYIICRCAYPMQLHPQITALPWFCL
jgi:predicted AAA+ superfamily ATPase